MFQFLSITIFIVVLSVFPLFADFEYEFLNKWWFEVAVIRLFLYDLSLFPIKMPDLTAARIDFGYFNFNYGADVRFCDCFSLNPCFGFGFDFFLSDLHEGISYIVLFSFCMYFIEHFPLVSLCRVKRLFGIVFFLYRKLSSSEF